MDTGAIQNPQDTWTRVHAEKVLEWPCWARRPQKTRNLCKQRTGNAIHVNSMSSMKNMNSTN
eukprot:11176414-Lingulodinium_polyedra.AAC.1